MLVDVRSRVVLRAGRTRIPATGFANDHSTKVEGDTIRRALSDCMACLTAMSTGSANPTGVVDGVARSTARTSPPPPDTAAVRQEIQLAIITDNKGWTLSHESVAVQGVGLRRRLRKPETGILQAVGNRAAALLEQGVHLSIQWQGAEHNMERASDQRLTVISRCNLVADYCAGGV